MEFISDSVSPDASNAPEIVDVSDGATRAGKGESIKTYLNAFAKAIVPFAFLTVMTGIAHAAPSIDMSGVTFVMLTVQAACLRIGAIIVLISLVFSVFSFAGGNIMRGVTGVAGVLFGGLVIGMGPTWISSLTGQAVG